MKVKGPAEAVSERYDVPPRMARLVLGSYTVAGTALTVAVLCVVL